MVPRVILLPTKAAPPGHAFRMSYSEDDDSNEGQRQQRWQIDIVNCVARGVLEGRMWCYCDRSSKRENVLE